MGNIYFKLFMVMVFWGSAFVSGKMLTVNHHPIVVAFLRFFIANLFLLPIFYWKNKRLLPEKKSNFLKFILLGLFGVCLYNLFFLTGLKTVEAGRSSLIIALNPVISTIFSFFIFKEELQLKQVSGIIIGLIGVFVVLTRGQLLNLSMSTITSGEIFLILAVFSWIIYTMLGKVYLNSISSHVAITWSCFFGLLFILPAALNYGLIPSITKITLIDGLNLINLSVFSTVIGFNWYYEGIKTLGISKTASFLNLLPLIGLLSGVLILDEKVTLPILVGAVLIITGIFFVNKKPKPRNISKGT